MQLPDKHFAAGRTAKLYAWKPGWALKVYDDVPWPTKRLCELEYANTRAMNEAGIPAPKVGEIFQIEGRWALELEHLTGGTLTDQFRTKPWSVFAIGRSMAKLQLKMHTVEIELDLPNQHERMRTKINNAEGLAETLRDQALDVLYQLPTGNCLCHGDFHIENIMLTDRGPVIIDWVDATRGHPLGDVARTVMIMRSIPHIADEHTTALENLMLRTATNAYLRTYLRHYEGDAKDLSGWIAVNCAARMSEDIPGQREFLIEQIKLHVNKWRTYREQQ